MENNTNTDTSSTRFSLIEIDDSPAPANSDTPAPAIPGETINEGGRRAAAAERQMLADVTGLELSDKGSGFGGNTGLVYDEGTTMLESGVAVALAGRAAWDRLPTATSAAARHSERIAAEQRADYRGVPLSRLLVNERGELAGVRQVAYDTDNSALRFTEGSWSQLRSDAPAGVLRNNFNAWLPSSEIERTLRTRRPREDGTRELFAALSDSYAIADGHELLEMIAAAVPSESRARVIYDEGTTRLTADLTLQNPYEFEDDIAVGRLHRFGVRLRTRDDGRGRIRINAYAERIACINCTLIPADWASLDRVHVGNVSEIHEAIRELAGRAGEAMGEFSNHWRAAHMTRIFGERYDAEDAAAAFAALVDGGFIEVDRTKPDEVIENLVRAWRVEPGNTYQAINRAITRAAHESSWRDDGEALEEQAGQLLYNRVHVCEQLGWA